MTNNNFLRTGDVFELTKGMAVYAQIPEKFVYQNRRTSDELTTTDIVVGQDRITYSEDKLQELRKLANQLTAKSDLLQNVDMFAVLKAQCPDLDISDYYDAHALIGDYVVVNTSMSGGGKGHGPNDVYPDGHHVVAKRLADNGTLDPNGFEVSFYQSGSFTAMNEYVPVIRRMTMTFA